MEQRLSIITLLVTDLARAREFYGTRLGWTEREPRADEIAFFQLNGILLGLYSQTNFRKETPKPYQAPAQDAMPGFTLALNLKDRRAVDELFEELRAAEVEIVKPPEEVFWGGYSGYFADPDGHLWEVAHNPFLKFDAEGNVLAPAPQS